MIEVTSLRKRNMERLGRRHGLYFHVDCYEPWPGGIAMTRGLLVSHNYAEDEPREATDEEVEMWYKIVGRDVNIDEIVATPEEIIASLKFRDGPFTLNMKDFSVIRKHLEFGFEPCSMRHLLLTGLMGWINQNPRVEIFVSRHIPVGFFYEGPRIPELHHRMDQGMTRQIEPPLPDGIKYSIELQAFQCYD